jgi:2-(acetamidomethylene)succinate hydrolase
VGTEQELKQFDLGSVNLVGAEAGRGPDTLFFFHGVTANHTVWQPIFYELSRDFRVIAVDQRGHGRSEKPREGYGPEEYAADVAALVRRYSSGGKNVIAGHSLGSRNAVVAASRLGGSVAGVVAIDFTPFIETAVFDALESRVAAGDRGFASVAEVSAYLEERYSRLPSDAIRRRAQYGYAQDSSGMLRARADPHAMQETVAGLRLDFSDAFRHLSVPTVVVRGADSVLVSEAAFRRSAQIAPHHRYVTVAGADHYVPEEQPKQIVELVRDFCSSL